MYLLASGVRGQSSVGESLERFAANPKELRAERGWSREDLSRHTQQHTTAISKMERTQSTELPDGRDPRRSLPGLRRPSFDGIP